MPINKNHLSEEEIEVTQNCGTEPPFSENYYMKKEKAFISALFVIINYLNQSQSLNLEQVGQVFMMQ